MLCPRVVGEHMCLQKMFTELVCFNNIHRCTLHRYTPRWAHDDPSLHYSGAALWLAGRHYEAKIVDLLSCHHHQMKMPIHIDEDNHELEIHVIGQCYVGKIGCVNEYGIAQIYKSFFSQIWTHLWKISPSSKLPRSNYFPFESHFSLHCFSSVFLLHSSLILGARVVQRSKSSHYNIKIFIQ